MPSAFREIQFEPLIILCTFRSKLINTVNLSYHNSFNKGTKLNNTNIKIKIMKRIIRLFITCVLSISLVVFWVSCNQSENVDLNKNFSVASEECFIDKEQAVSLALALSLEINSQNGSTKGTVEILDVESYGNKEEPAYYVINYEDENGFIILSADSRTPVVLAFSEAGNFEINNEMPPALIEWMKNTEEMVYSVRNGEIEPLAPSIRPLLCEAIQSLPLKEETNNETSTTYRIDPCNDDNQPNKPVDCMKQTKVGPLLETTWHQQGAFNDQVPYYCGYDQAPAGCVAISVAQVMYYHQHPTQFNWSAMDLMHGTSESARLIADIGYKVGMNYDCGGSGAYNSDIPKLLKNQYGYTSASYSKNFNSNTIKAQISSGNPVILGGISDEAGHSWVCDGYIYTNMCTYSTLTFHMNWGWGGSPYDGWFSFEDWNPKGGKGYYKNKDIVYNIIK